MAYSYFDYEGTDTTIQTDILCVSTEHMYAFKVLSEDKSKVTLSDVALAATFTKNNAGVLCELNTAPSTKIRVIRSTPYDVLMHDFNNGAQFNADSVDEVYEQLLYLCQETVEGKLIMDSSGISGTSAGGVSQNELQAQLAAVKNEILGGASAEFDTLKELAAALGNDANFARTIADALAACLKTADLAAETAKLVTRRNYTRTITGTADSSKSMSVAGNVTVYPDGRIVQIIHVKDLRMMWFALESAGVGFNGSRHRRIPLQLWTAMPNAVTDVRPVFIRATNAAASQTYASEAAEWICAWSLFAQGGSKTAVNIDASRFRGDVDEPIDLYVVIEGY